MLIFALLLGDAEPELEVHVEHPPLPEQGARWGITLPGYKYPVVVCEDFHLGLRVAKEVIDEWRMLGHKLGPVVPGTNEDCYGDPMAGVIYIDTDVTFMPGHLGQAHPLEVGGVVAGGMAMVSPLADELTVFHEIGHILGYEHSKDGRMAPDYIMVAEDPHKRGLSVWAKKDGKHPVLEQAQVSAEKKAEDQAAEEHSE